MATSPGNAVNETTTGICGFTGTAFTATPATQYAVQVGGSTSSTLTSLGTGSTGQILQSGGAAANPAYSTATYPSTAGSSGKILISDGTNIVSSTPTYPNSATGTGKILRADGTNWAASTATYPDTGGTSGNVLTSDGTNWSSSARVVPLASFSTAVGSPLDGATYYFVPLAAFNNNIDNTLPTVRFYIPYTCTLDKAYGSISVQGTLASAQNCTLFIRKNNSSNTNLSTTLQLTAADNPLAFTGIGLSLVPGDYIAIGFTGPTWTTNPTLVSIGITLST